MKKILTAAQMKAADKNTIQNHGISSLVLMERAALTVANEMKKNGLCKGSILSICGVGNNGADGVAIARILHLKGKKASILLVGKSEKRTEELVRQIDIAKSYGIAVYEFHDGKVQNTDEPLNTFLNRYRTIVDALFGIGLSREISDEYADIIGAVNSCKAKIVAVDIPSGYSADTGKELGIGIHPDITVTFSYVKKGLLLSDCYKKSGKLVCRDAGICVAEAIPHSLFEITNSDIKKIPRRRKDSNKGSLGKLLIIAGSKEVYGACYLSALAAMRAGVGYVKIVTHKSNVATLQDKLPEAVVISYDESSFTQKDATISEESFYLNFDFEEKINAAISWSSSVLIGPGLSQDALSISLFDFIISNSNKPLVIDADGLNILSKDLSILSKIDKTPLIITPHLMEMSRLTGISVKEIDSNMEQVAIDFIKDRHFTVLLKNYTSIITNGKKTFINASGNEALATAGSGDVLSGIVASLLAFGLKPVKAAAIGAYVHGKAGIAAASKCGSKNVLASEIANSLADIIT